MWAGTLSPTAYGYACGSGSPTCTHTPLFLFLQAPGTCLRQLVSLLWPHQTLECKGTVNSKMKISCFWIAVLCLNCLRELRGSGDSGVLFFCKWWHWIPLLMTLEAAIRIQHLCCFSKKYDPVRQDNQNTSLWTFLCIFFLTKLEPHHITEGDRQLCSIPGLCSWQGGM